jgi:hypothetical protein
VRGLEREWSFTKLGMDEERQNSTMGLLGQLTGSVKTSARDSTGDRQRMVIVSVSEPDSQKSRSSIARRVRERDRFT